MVYPGCLKKGLSQTYRRGPVCAFNKSPRSEMDGGVFFYTFLLLKIYKINALTIKPVI